MTRFWQRKAALLSALLFLFGAAVPSAAAWASTVDSQAEETAGMEAAARTKEASLYLDKENALLCLVDNASGVAVRTKIMDGESGNADIQANQKSDFIISYWKHAGGWKDVSATGGTTVQTNYAMAIESGQMEYEMIENGVRITYDLKEDRLSLDCVPKYINEARMEELVLKHISSRQRQWLNEYYRLYDGYYTCTKKDGEVTQSVIRQLYEIFYETGEYTQEELAADNEEFDYESNWNNLEITVSLEYTLDGGDLVVRMPMESLTVNDDSVVINTVTLLPYLLSATQQEEGYIVVPDGCGALIEFNNGLINANDYSSRVYGKDALLDVRTGETADYYANMPVIGMVYEDYALLAIVENGQSLAEINAKISGKTDHYNNAYFRFYMTERENVATSDSSSVQVNKYTGDPFDEDIVIRYKLLTNGEDVNYTGLAHAYQQYLIGQGILTRQNDIKPALTLELFGSTLEAKTFLRVPYYGVKALTTFEDAESILKELKSRGIKDADIQLNGWLSGGERHEKLSGVKPESSQGSKSDFAALTKTASELGYGLYPDISLQEINESFDFLKGGSAKRYAKKYGSRLLSNEYAIKLEQDPGSSMKSERIWSRYLLSPAHLVSYTNTAMKGLSGYNLSGLTVTDLGNSLVADYNEKKPMSREHAAEEVSRSISALAEEYDVVMKVPYQYAWQGVSVMTDLPARSNEFTLFNYDIPFLQLVLDGCVSYSTEALNFRTEKDLKELLLTCIETRSNPKFFLMESDMSELYYVMYAQSRYPSVNFDAWADRMTELWLEYEEFFAQTAGSPIKSHERLSEQVVRVAYGNGVTVYLNYGDQSADADGVKLAAKSFLLVK